MNYLRPKNWQKFQHYRGRLPPWIKLHRSLLEDDDFLALGVAAKAVAPFLWMIAAEDKHGFIPYDVPELATRLKMAPGELVLAIKQLVDKRFFAECSEDERASSWASSTNPQLHQLQASESDQTRASNASSLEGVSTPTPKIWGQPWEQRLRGYKPGGFWVAMWGPRPEQAGCQVPRDLLDPWREAHAR